MIFVTVGSRDYQFDRLFKELDRLFETNQLSKEVFCQIGNSLYEPKYFPFKKYITQQEFDHYQNSADIIITHGGTGSIITALKKNKKVIAVPRLKKYKEHIDDHQREICDALEQKNYLLQVIDMSKLVTAINQIESTKLNVFATDGKIINIIGDYLNGI